MSDTRQAIRRLNDAIQDFKKVYVEELRVKFGPVITQLDALFVRLQERLRKGAE